MGVIDKIVLFVKDLIGKLTDEEKRRLVLFATAGFCVILIITVVLSVKKSGGEKESDVPEKTGIQIPIAAEEIFLPDEPDFIPGVILGRQQRSSWTEEDAAIFWRDPLVHGEEPWREKIETVIDDFLEHVP